MTKLNGLLSKGHLLRNPIFRRPSGEPRTSRDEAFFQQLVGVKFLIIVAMMIAIHGCGGGSKGTGGDQLYGRVLTTQNTPLGGVTVTELDSGETAVTNSEGSFSITTDLPSGTIRIGLDSGNASATVSVMDVPEEVFVLAVTIQFDQSRGTATAIEVDITERPKSPTPRPTRQATISTPASPSPTPTAPTRATPVVPPTKVATATPSRGGETSTPTPAPEPTEDDDDDDGDEEEIEDTGTVSAVNSTSITVSRRTYVVTSGTEVRGEDVDSIGDIRVGDIVKVKGERRDGRLEATRIELRSGDEDKSWFQK